MPCPGLQDIFDQSVYLALDLGLSYQNGVACLKSVRYPVEPALLEAESMFLEKALLQPPTALQKRRIRARNFA